MRHSIPRILVLVDHSGKFELKPSHYTGVAMHSTAYSYIMLLLKRMFYFIDFLFYLFHLLTRDNFPLI